MDLLSCRIRVVLVASSAMLFSATLAPLAKGQGSTQILVATGDVVPSGDAMFADFGHILARPALNNAGQVSFYAELTGPASKNAGIYRAGGPGATVQIARKGQLTGAGTLSALGDLHLPINNQGQVAFHARYTSEFGDDGVFRGDGSNLVSIALDTQLAPDGNGEFSGFESNYLLLNEVGQVGFYGFLVGTSGGFSDDRGLFRSDGSSLVQIARTNQDAPDGDGTFEDLPCCVTGPSMNDLGDMAFVGVVGALNDGAYVGAGTSITQVVREGKIAPDGNGVIQSVGDLPRTNNSREVIVFARRTGTFGGASDGVGLFRVAGATMTPIALEGHGAPGGGAFDNLLLGRNVALNDPGDMAFVATLDTISDPPSNDLGVYLALRGLGPIRLVMRDGQRAVDGTGIIDIPADVPALNNAGQVAFPVFFRDAIGAAIYLGDGIEVIQAARTGQTLAGSTISSLLFATDSITSSDEKTGLNDFAQVAYRATLADGREVIALFTPDVRWRNDIGGEWDDAANWTLSIPPGSVHKVRVDPASNLTVMGPATHAAVKSLTVGGGSGLATLQLQSGGTLEASDGVTIDTGGLLAGSGTINSRLSVLNGGEVVVAAGETITLSGASASENRNRVLLSGGTLNFLGAANVDAFINYPKGLVAGQGTLRTNSQLSNRGLMLFNGTTNILGDVENAQGALLATSGGTTTFIGDVVNNAEIRTSTGGFSVFFGSVAGGGTFTGGGTVVMEGDLLPGASPTQINFGGDLVFGHASTLQIELGGTAPGTQFDRLEIAGAAELGGTLDVLLSNGFSPTEGDSFEVLRADGGVFGAFSTTSLPALSSGLDWNLVYSDFAVLLQVSAVGTPGDYNRNGSVDAADYVVWRNTLGQMGAGLVADGNRNGTVDAGDYDVWRAHFGTTAASASAGSIAVIPEPETLILFLLALAAGPACRLRRAVC